MFTIKLGYRYNQCKLNHFIDILGVFAALFSVIGLTLNILMVLALKPVAESDLPTLMVISLSFSDLVFCVFTLPLQSARFLFR